MRGSPCASRRCLSQPPCSPDGSSSANNMSNPIRLNSRAIAVEADKYGATEYSVRSNGRDFLVTAHSKAEADAAAEYYRAPEADESQPDLLK